MDSGYAALARIHVPRMPTDEAPERLTAGIPLTKMIKRKLVRGSGIVMTDSPRSAPAVSLRRLKTICRELNTARHEITEQVDILSKDLVDAYQNMADQVSEVAMTSEVCIFRRR